ncbi:MAG: putative toxin-antitoxin system toxin component, PIN family [Desulfobacca sp. 4484_104]|nr:MAG: putative toxin-antitoxin system toxin component, PIN family [Desulfobacca sp. 4484_104]
MLKLALDTNIIISALHKADSDPDLILSLVLDRDSKLATLYLSKDIYQEYEEVLFRNKFSYFSRAKVRNILEKIQETAVWVEPAVPVKVVKVDPADNKFLECALACEADFLITGNIKHFPLRKFRQTKIVSPGNFIELIGQGIIA